MWNLQHEPTVTQENVLIHFTDKGVWVRLVCAACDHTETSGEASAQEMLDPTATA